MQTLMRARLRRFGALALFVGAAGCTDFLTVPNPGVIDAATVDPVADAVTLANSAKQNFAVSYGLMIMYSAWFTGEAQVAETFPTRNEFAQRAVNATNGSHNADVWTPLSRAMAASRLVLKLALPTPTTNANYAQAALYAGYSFLFMAEQFCVGAVDGGPALTTQNMLDSAIANFSNVIAIGAANGAAPATTYATAALVGRARANLQRGNNAAALADANAVPTGFNFNVDYVDDLASRGRLSNQEWIFVRDRGSILVAAPFRIANNNPGPPVTPNANPQGGLFLNSADTRVPVVDGGVQVPALLAQDARRGPFWITTKYVYATPIRLASKLEADYIAQEVQPGGPTLAFVNARRAAGGQPALIGPTVTMTDLMDQKAFDFYLEGKRMGDFRRLDVTPAYANASVGGVAQSTTPVQFMPVPGSVYFKAGFAPTSNRTCYPLPQAETDNNLNHPSSP